MQTIALIAQKGGVGKTTIAIHLATAFAASGRNTLILDLDPQASAAEWKDHRAAEMPAVLSIQASRLSRVMEEARGIGTELVILDTAPHSESASLDAARLADLILVPCQPTIMDLRAMRKTADLLRLVGKPAYAILNNVPARGTVANEAAETIAADFQLPVAPVRFSDRVVFNRCLITGQAAQEIEPNGRAAQEVAQALEWVSALLSKRATQHRSSPGSSLRPSAPVDKKESAEGR
jgi:chromosome partitioning protein